MVNVVALILFFLWGLLAALFGAANGTYKNDPILKGVLWLAVSVYFLATTLVLWGGV